MLFLGMEMSKIVHVFVRVFNTTTATVNMKLGLNEKCFLYTYCRAKNEEGSPRK